MKPSTPGATLYLAREFARRAGVTVRTLHHYDRLGLLRPHARTAGEARKPSPQFERPRPTMREEIWGSDRVLTREASPQRDPRESPQVLREKARLQRSDEVKRSSMIEESASSLRSSSFRHHD